MPNELKPCPFCGGEAEFIGNSRSIKCKNCGGAFICTNSLTSAFDVAHAWNTRADHATEKDCSTCMYFDNDRNDQPCCGCASFSNWEKYETEKGR